MTAKRRIFFCLGIALIASTGASATDKKDAKPLFAADDPIRLTITAPLADLASSYGKSKRPAPGTLAVIAPTPEQLAIAVSTRGVTRGDRDICPFPPLRIDFPQKPTGGSLFKGQSSLKLVTHCRPDAVFQDYVRLEYAAYRMYALLTPESFGVRLAEVDYVNKNGRKLATKPGFFIEDVKDVARRAGDKRLKIRARIASSALDPRAAARFAMFEYMIGNLDWSMTAASAGTPCCHNSRLIATKGTTTGLTPVPYDFDFSGLVDAPYATPPEGFHQPNVRVRFYQGICAHNEAARAAAAELLERRAAITGVLDAVPDLGAGRRDKAKRYLDEFFGQIGTPGGVATVLKTCRG